jgi:hypothetical protein
MGSPAALLEAVVSQIAFHAGAVSMKEVFLELETAGIALDVHQRAWVSRELLGANGVALSLGTDGLPSHARATVALQERALGITRGLVVLTETLYTILRTIARRSVVSLCLAPQNPNNLFLSSLSLSLSLSLSHSLSLSLSLSVCVCVCHISLFFFQPLERLQFG